MSWHGCDLSLLSQLDEGISTVTRVAAELNAYFNDDE